MQNLVYFSSQIPFIGFFSLVFFLKATPLSQINVHRILLVSLYRQMGEYNSRYTEAI